MHSRSLFRLNGLLIALHAAGAAVLWPRLPGRIPLHFGPGGEPDRWVETSAGAWFLLPGLALATALLVSGLSRLAARSPELWSVPDKELFLRLAREDRAPIVEALEAYLARVSLLVTLVFMAVHWGIYTTAVGITEGLPGYVMLFVAGAVVLILAGAVPMSRTVKRRIREAAGRA